MACPYFQRKEYSAFYEKHMIREPEEVQKLILSYLEEKKGRPFGLAVDVGCGTGQSTRVLASHFQKVVGVDISNTQIQEAENVACIPNVSYMVAPAEHLPFEDSSVDLITASVAAHWFNSEEFFREADRVLKPSGCLALYCFNPVYELHYKDCTAFLTDAFMEALEFLICEFGGEIIGIMRSEYKQIFDSVPFADKTRVTKILLKCSMSVSALMGYFESICLFQNFFVKDSEAAKNLLQELQERILKIMGVSSPDTELEVYNNYFCVLACKPA